MDGHSSLASRHTTERIPERNHNWRATGACEGHLQVSAVFNLSAELAKLICDGIYDLSPHVGKSDAGILSNDSRTAQVQELASNHDAVSAVLRLHLNIDLKGVRAIKHLPRASACRSSSFEKWLQKTVEENFDTAARSLLLTRQRGSCKRCLGESDGVLGRLVIRFRSRRLANLLPQRNCFHTTFAALLQVLLHQMFLAGAYGLIHEIDPLPGRKVFHLFPPNSFLRPERSPVDGTIHHLHGIREGRSPRNIESVELGKSCGIREFADQDEGSPEVRMGVLLPEFLHRVLQRACHVAASEEFSIEELHQLRSALIVDVPQRQQQRRRSGAEKASLKSEQFVAGGDEVHACGAAAQGHELGVQPHLVEVI